MLNHQPLSGVLKVPKYTPILVAGTDSHSMAAGTDSQGMEVDNVFALGGSELSISTARQKERMEQFRGRPTIETGQNRRQEIARSRSFTRRNDHLARSRSPSSAGSAATVHISIAGADDASSINSQDSSGYFMVGGSEGQEQGSPQTGTSFGMTSNYHWENIIPPDN